MLLTQRAVKGRLGQWKVKEKDPDFGRKFPASKQVMVTLTMKAAKEDLIDRLLISAYTLGTVRLDRSQGRFAGTVH